MNKALHSELLTGYFQKKFELQKMNFSETGESEKFGKFCLTQGLTYETSVIS